MSPDKELVLQLEDDFVASQFKKSTSEALAEIVWNGLDANASRVEVQFDSAQDPISQSPRTTKIVVIDDGEGIPVERAFEAFQKLGGSWKRSTTRPQRQRVLHGRAGKGRLAAFALGARVEWRTVYTDGDGQRRGYSIGGSRINPKRYIVTEGRESDAATGTTVAVERAENDKPTHFTEAAISKLVGDLTKRFALYLTKYKDVSIVVDGLRIDPATLIDSQDSYVLPPVESEVGPREVTIDVIEWKNQSAPREVYLADSGGFPLAEAKMQMHAPGFAFAVYVKSDLFRQMDDEAVLDLHETNPVVVQLLDSVKECIRMHFERRRDEKQSNLIDDLKEQKAYPYEGDPNTTAEAVERQIFDTYAASLSKGLAVFGKSSPEGKRFVLSLVRQSLERDPLHLQRLIEEVVGLSPDERQKLSDLLERTTLPNIINASRLVADRLHFITALESLVYDEDNKKVVKERKHLHRLLAENTWVFGEEYNLSNDDESLRTVLKKHLGDGTEVVDPVVMEDGRVGIVDLVLARSIPQQRDEEREYLVIELKRPSVNISPVVLEQTRGYATAVSGDPRFNTGKTRWLFMAVSGSMTDAASRQANMRGLPRGVFGEWDDPPVTLVAKTWAEIISGCKARLQVFQRQLKYAADRESSMDFVRANWGKYLPPRLLVRSEEVD